MTLDRGLSPPVRSGRGNDGSLDLRGRRSARKTGDGPAVRSLLDVKATAPPARVKATTISPKYCSTGFVPSGS